MMCTVDDDIDILWETDMLPTPLKTVYMFYLNWQTFIQTSIMCNVNILSINYIAPLPHLLPLEKLFTQQISIPAKTSGINQEDFKQFFLTAGVSYR